MTKNRAIALPSILAIAAALALGGCAKREAADASATAPASAATPAGGGKIPVTTASAEARSEFLQGRDMFEKLLGTDSIPHFQKAVSLDPNFAWAELNLANTAPTAKEFFDHLARAAALADKASNGERLLILAADAGAKNDALKQKEYLEQLVAAYPDDERAHFNFGTYFFGQQDYGNAIGHYKRSTEINPDYSNAYNLLGYAYRQTGDYANAEKAFQKYIELIPKDPNPYDSYAELLLKMGRFEDSIAQYRKALEINSTFTNAHQGIAMDLMQLGKTNEAASELETMEKKSRTDGERRTALLALTVLHVDGGKLARALQDVDRQYALGEKTGDVPAMAADCNLKGNILLEMGRPDPAKAEFEHGVKLIEGSTLAPENKANARLILHFDLARVALAKNDLAAAKREADEYRTGASNSKNPAQRRFPHELDGVIALSQKDYDKAISELQQANLQNPQNLYRLGVAYRGKGDEAKAKEYFGKAANFNSLPQINYAFVRAKAKSGAGEAKKA
jgi:tetratricopeptide (TPR) repeat protein